MTAARLAALTVLAVALAVCVSAWPALTLLGMSLSTVLALSWRSPVLGLVAALFLFSLEGSFKALLTADAAPSPNGVTAGTLDLALASAALRLVVLDRGESLRLLWGRADRMERGALALLCLWLLVSLFQLPIGGDLKRALDGFRLTQAYVFLMVAGLVVSRRTETIERFVRPVLWGLLVLAGYAAIQTLTGPTSLEANYVLSRAPGQFGVSYAGHIRTFGTLSGAIGLASVLVPAVVFAIAAGTFLRIHRRLAWTGAGLGLIALLGSYVRVSLVAIVASALLLVAYELVRTGSHHRRVALVGGVAALILLAAGGTVIATRGSHQLQERARGLIDPGSDQSLNDRLHTWSVRLREFGHQPFGRGIGTVGNATVIGTPNKFAVTTDNSFLKVLIEQGFYGAALFVLGLFGVCAVTARRLLRAPALDRKVGFAALLGFLSFAILWSMDEYIEQPGKALAWVLLGVAVGIAFDRTELAAPEEVA